MDSKNFHFLFFILKNRGGCTITEIVKLAYLIDLAAQNDTKLGKKISNFEYTRYYYGPYSKDIQTTLEQGMEQKIITISTGFSANGYDYTVYSVNNDDNRKHSQVLNSEEEKFICEMLEDLAPYRATSLTEIAYNTKPMKDLGATLGGNEHLHEVLL